MARNQPESAARCPGGGPLGTWRPRTMTYAATPCPTPASGPRARSMRTVKSAAAELDVDERTIWRAIARGELTVHRFGRAVRIADDDFRRYVASKRQA